MQLLRRPAWTLRRPRQRSLFVFAVVLVALIVSPAAQAAEKGVNTDLTWGLSEADQDRTGAVVLDSGARWALITVSWRAVEYDAKGTYDQAQLDSVDHAVSVLNQAGVNVIATVFATPRWASADPDEQYTPPTDPADYADFMKFLADRYKGRVAAYEIWNEEDLSRFWKPAPDAAAYAGLLKAAYPKVKEGDPNARVLFGGTQFNDYSWLEQVYAAEPTIGQYFDVMATHPYPPNRHAPEDVRYCTVADPDNFCPVADGRMSKDSFPAYRLVRDTLLAHGNDKPIWFTEVGWSSASGNAWGVSEATQADYLTRAYRYIEGDPYVQVAVWYNLRNSLFGNDGPNWDDQLGLLRTDFSPKPSYAAFRAILNENPSVPGIPPPPSSLPSPPDGPVAAPASLRLSVFRMTPARFRAARRGPSVRAAAGGTVLRYVLSRSATMYFRVDRAISGRRWRRMRGGFSRAAKPGANAVRFSGRLSGRALSPGLYRMVGWAISAAGKRTPMRRASFRVIR